MSPTATRAAAHLIDEDIAQLLSLIKGSDSVELKLTIPESAVRSTAETLGADPLDAQIRQVYFLDTPDLRLNKAGLVVRARRVQGRGDDTVVKLRPVVPEQLPKSLRASPKFNVEVDAMRGGYVCSASLRADWDATAVKQAVSGSRPLRKLYSKGQRTLFAEHAPDGLAIDDLMLLGPLNVLKLKMSPKSFGRKLVVEVWFYPDGSRLTELSTKCAPTDALEVGLGLRARLEELDVPIEPKQETKTRRALAYYAKALSTENEPPTAGARS